MAAEGGLQLGRVERVQEGAQRVDGRGAAEAGAEGGVEPLAVHADEQADAAVGGRAGQDGQDAEQQQVGEAVAPALAAARVRDLQGGEQAGERHHGGLRCGGRSALNGPGAPPVPRPHPTSQTAHGQNRTALGPDPTCPRHVGLVLLHRDHHALDNVAKFGAVSGCRTLLGSSALGNRGVRLSQQPRASAPDGRSGLMLAIHPNARTWGALEALPTTSNSR